MNDNLRCFSHWYSRGIIIVKHKYPKSPIPPYNRSRRPGSGLRAHIITRLFRVGTVIIGTATFLLGLLAGSYGQKYLVGFQNWILCSEILSVVLGAYWFKKFVRTNENYELGLDGELYVGNILDRLRLNNWETVHDFNTGTGNIDHILITPHGLFTVETKTVSMISKEENTVYYDCEKVWTDKRVSLECPLNQAKAEAAYLSGYIAKKTGIKLFVNPIVTYPGWEVQYKGILKLYECPVWVLATKQIDVVIKKLSVKLSQEQMSVIFNVLTSDETAQG